MVQYLPLPDGRIGVFNDEDSKEVIQQKIKERFSKGNPSLNVPLEWPLELPSNDPRLQKSKSQYDVNEQNLLKREDQLFEANNPITRTINTVAGTFVKESKHIGLEPDTEEALREATEVLFGPRTLGNSKIPNPLHFGGGLALRAPYDLASLVFEGANALFQPLVNGLAQGFMELGLADQKGAREIAEFAKFAAMFLGAEGAALAGIPRVAVSMPRVAKPPVIAPAKKNINSVTKSKTGAPQDKSAAMKTPEPTAVAPPTLLDGIADDIVSQTKALNLPPNQKAAVAQGVKNALQSAREKVWTVSDEVNVGMMNWWDRFRTNITSQHAFNRYHEAADLLNNEELSYLAAELQNTGGWAGVVELALKHNAPKVLTKERGIGYEGAGLQQVLAPLGKPGVLGMNKTTRDRTARWFEYMVARREEEIVQQTMTGRRSDYKPLMTQEERAALLNVGEDTALFEKVAKDYQQWNARILNFAEDMGYLTKTEKANMLQMGQDFFPLYRYVDDASGKGGAPRNPFKFLKGSDRHLRNPSDAMVGNAASIIRLAVVNRAKADTLLRLEQAFPEVVQRVQRDTPSPEAIEQLTSSMVQEGASINSARETARLLYSNTKAGQETVRINGKHVTFQVNDPALVKAFENLNPKTQSAFVKMGSSLARLVRNTTVTMPQFVFRALWKDTINSMLVSDAKGVFGFTPFDTARGLHKRLTGSHEYKMFLANGGGFGNRWQGEALAHSPVANTLSYFRIRPQNILDSSKTLGNRFLSWATPFEETNRLAEFIKLRKQGVSLAEATRAARNISTDFSLRPGNDFMQQALAMVPFGNAVLQSTARTLTVAAQNPGRTLARGLATATLPAAAMYLYNKDNPHYWSLPSYTRDMYFVMYPDKDKPESAVLIPKGFELGFAFATLTENFLKSIEESRGKIFAESFARFMLQFGSGVTRAPTVFDMFYRQATGTTWTGAPIVPRYLEEGEDKYEFDQTTNPLIVKAAQALNISPMKLQYAFTSMFSQLANTSLMVYDIMEKVMKGEEIKIWEIPPFDAWVRPTQGRPTQEIMDFYDFANKIEETSHTYKQLVKFQKLQSLDKPEQERLRLADQWSRKVAVFSRKLDDYNKLIRSTVFNENLSPQQKEKLINRYNSEKQKTIKTFMNIADQTFGDQEGWLDAKDSP